MEARTCLSCLPGLISSSRTVTPSSLITTDGGMRFTGCNVEELFPLQRCFMHCVDKGPPKVRSSRHIVQLLLPCWRCISLAKVRLERSLLLLQSLWIVATITAELLVEVDVLSG